MKKEYIIDREKEYSERDINRDHDREAYISRNHQTGFELQLETKITEIREMFLAMKIRSSFSGIHYIVKDSINDYYYLKINKFSDFEEYSISLKFFQALMDFSQKYNKPEDGVVQILRVSNL